MGYKVNAAVTTSIIFIKRFKLRGCCYCADDTDEVMNCRRSQVLAPGYITYHGTQEAEITLLKTEAGELGRSWTDQYCDITPDYHI
ncbi:hypothetical protein VULLAG_LOCUS11373 [Vulpes lagopus]